MESTGRCYFCLKHLSPTYHHHPDVKPDPESEQNLYPLQCLLRYLKLDLAMTQNCSPYLITHRQIDYSNLQVLLCEGCARVTEEFSKLYLELEKIDMMVQSTLKIIQGKIQEGEEINESGCSTLVSEPRRTEIIQKCLLKLNSFPPRINVRNLTTEEIEEKKRKNNNTRLMPGGDGPMILPVSIVSKFESATESDIEIGHVKVERLENSIPDEDNIYDSDNTNSDMESYGESSSDSATSNPNNKSSSLKKRRTKWRVMHNQSFIRLEPSGASVPKKLRSIFNANTKQYQCTTCSSEFPTDMSFKRHYQSVHLKSGRVKCTLCEKEFSEISGYYNHHKNMHMGIRFSCKICSKTFSYSHHLQRHLRETSCATGQASVPKPHKFYCDPCGSGFTCSGGLQKHLKTVHSEVREFECEICEKKFKERAILSRHRREVHLKLKRITPRPGTSAD